MASLGRLVPQLLHDWAPLHNLFIGPKSQMLFNAALTKLVS